MIFDLTAGPVLYPENPTVLTLRFLNDAKLRKILEDKGLFFEVGEDVGDGGDIRVDMPVHTAPMHTHWALPHSFRGRYKDSICGEADLGLLIRGGASGHVPVVVTLIITASDTKCVVGLTAGLKVMVKKPEV